MSPPSPESVRAELQKILASTAFAQAERLRTFLRFTVEHTLDRPGEPLKEYVIGTTAYGRDDSFDPRIDAMVRVDATRLRAKLRDYYGAEGSTDPNRIDLPRGSYTPVFTTRPGPPSHVTITSGPSIAVLPFVNLSGAPRHKGRDTPHHGKHGRLSSLPEGRHQWNLQTPEGFRKAIAYFQEALTLNPSYAPGLARLADTYNLIGIWGPSRVFCPRADSPKH